MTIERATLKRSLKTLPEPLDSTVSRKRQRNGLVVYEYDLPDTTANIQFEAVVANDYT